MRQENPVFKGANVPHVETIIEGYFRETTRNGKQTLRYVFLALTPGVLLITERFKLQKSDQKCTNRPSLHTVDSLKMVVFKNSQRQTLKICFGNDTKRYFELEETYRRKTVWAMWCKQVSKLHHRNTKILWLKKEQDRKPGLDWNIINQKWKPQNFVWNDKYLYLGSRRENEDRSRPSPVPGLGRAENIKLLYLKPQYFGCWDQSEHWVQCDT